MWHGCGTAEVHSELWLGDLTEGEHLEDLGTDRRKILKWIFKNLDRGLDWIDLS